MTGNNNNGGEETKTGEKKKRKNSNESSSGSGSGSEDDDSVKEIPKQQNLSNNINQRARTSVSAEVFGKYNSREAY